MKTVLAYDCGGTKTHVALFDLEGRWLFDVVLEGSNHQSSNMDHYQSVIQRGLEAVLTETQYPLESIERVFLGVSGADLPSDFMLLNDATALVFQSIPFEIVNDAWIIFRSGVQYPYGAVAICGTGMNAAAMDQHQNQAILRSLGFTLGTYGGGLDIAREAMHYAFRADELSYHDTMLRHEIPRHFNVASMNEVVDLFYPTMKVNRHQMGAITGLVNHLANQNDKVCKEILNRVGAAIGMQTLGVIRQLSMQNERFPCVYGGRVFDGESPLLLKAFKRIIRKECPHVFFVKPKIPPVAGAYLFALDRMGIKQTDHMFQHLVHGRNGI